MRYSYGRALLWLALYLLLVLLPLGSMLLAEVPSGRGFWVEFGAALGFAGLGMLCLQFVITARFRSIAPGFGSDNLLQFHYVAGLVAMAFILLHPAAMLWGERGYLAFLDPRVNFMRAFSLIAAILGVSFLILTSLWRKTIRLVYEWWRLTHGVVAFLVITVALAHTINVAHFSDLWWERGVIVLYCAGAMAMVMYSRVIRPLRMKRRPYEVREVQAERADSVTLILEPRGHKGFDFQPGQYAWLTLGKTPFSLQQHPFSIASSAEHPKRLHFTAKGEGDFTRSLNDVKPGSSAFLEGPYGTFSPRDEPGTEGSVFVAGGVGITPMMSMLRTLADRGDTRPYLLFYANKRWEDVIFRDELEALKERLDLEVIHVLEEPPPDWKGEEGFVDAQVLERHLRKPYEAWFYYICGPTPMMEMVEKTLVGWKISKRRVMSERFEIV